MENRQHNLLRLIIESFIDTAEPVGSKFLVSEYDLEMSDATVRNEMRDLEEAGFLTHPHTSAGRVPTADGYRLYVSELLIPVQLSRSLKNKISSIIFAVGDTEDEGRSRLKELGKLVAEEMSNAVIVAFGENHVYYTGLSNLFSQPEFQNSFQTVDVSGMFDRCEEIMIAVLEKFSDTKPRILIGEDNPFGSVCSVIGARLPDNRLFTIMGPQRMDYSKGKSILDFMYQHYV